MTKRPTKAEIEKMRSILANPKVFQFLDTYEARQLLAEIDALREEMDKRERAAFTAGGLFLTLGHADAIEALEDGEADDEHAGATLQAYRAWTKYKEGKK